MEVIDPWNLYLSVLSLVGGALLIFLKVTKEQLLDDFKASITACNHLDLNISTTLVELATTFMKMFGNEGEKMLQKARGSYVPHRIQNRTGSLLSLWSDDDVNATLGEPHCHDRDNLLTHYPIVRSCPRDHCPPYCTFSPFLFVLVRPHVLADQ